MLNEKVDCNYIANKIVERCIKSPLILTAKRLNKLVLLVNIAYAKQHNEFVVKNDYFLWPSGFVIPKIYYKYSNNGNSAKCCKVEEKTQQDYEKDINPKLKIKIEKIIDKILEITNYIDTIDLIDVLRVDIVEDENTVIYQEEIIDIYKNFNFKVLEELNRQEKQYFNN